MQKKNPGQWSGFFFAGAFESLSNGAFESLRHRSINAALLGLLPFLGEELLACRLRYPKPGSRSQPTSLYCLLQRAVPLVYRGVIGIIPIQLPSQIGFEENL